MKKGKLFSRFHPAVISVYAAVIAASALLPSIPLLGTGGTFSIATALVPLAGVFFGPVAGALCAAIGGFVGQLIAPNTAWLGIATFLIGVVAALAAGLVATKKWYVSLGLILLGTVLWFFHPIGQQAPIFPAVFYGSGAVAGVLAAFVGYSWLKSNNVFKKSVAVFLAAYIAMVASASLANFTALIVFQIPAETWTLLAFMAPMERASFSIGSVIVGVPLLIGLPKIGIFIGPALDEEVEAED
ncbi:MAG: ECF transporter S component [Bacillota bacterium]